MRKIMFNLLVLTVFFNIWIPKGGIKVQQIPLTMGNMAYIILLLFFVISLLVKQKIYKDKMQIVILICIVLFVFRLMFASLNNSITFGNIIYFLAPLCVYPFMYIITYNHIWNEKQLYKIMDIITYGFLFICIYGIIQNIFGINKVTIPGITVNYSDYKESPLWYLAKSNGRGITSKTVSTYQNGNILGANLLLIFPLVFEVIKRRKIESLILFSIVGLLTLSRSCWFGMGIYFLLRFIFNKNIQIKTIISRIIIVLILIVAIPYAFNNLPQLQGRMMQTTLSSLSTLSGRTPNAINLLNSSTSSIVSVFIGPYGIAEYQGGASEMTYLAVYMVSGILGLLLFLVPITLVLYRLKEHSKGNMISKGCYYGILTYAITAFIEGAFWLPPTALNLWIIAAIGMVSIRLEKNIISSQQVVAQ